jgi:hypothetical protein
MDGKFREMQGEARATGAGGSEELRSLAREVAALGMLIGQLAEEQRRTLATAEGSIRSRLESQLDTHIATMQEVAEQMGEQHQAQGRAMLDLGSWTAAFEERAERLIAMFGRVEARANALGRSVEAAGERSAPREERLDRLLAEAAREREEERERRRGRAVRMVCLLALAAVLGGVLVAALPSMGLPMIGPR